MSNAARKISFQRSSSLTTIDVNFDSSGFEQSQYTAAVSTTLHIQNAPMNDRMTVYILSEDGQNETTSLLDTASKVTLSGGESADVEVTGTGNFQLSLDAPPVNQPLAGRTVPISVPS